MSCPHIAQIATLEQPRLSNSVHREECTQCFENQDTVDGIDVCLKCFNGGCLDVERHHARTHVARLNHPFTLNVKRRPKARSSPHRGDFDQPPAKMTKLEILEEREEDKFDYITTVKCWICDTYKGLELPDATKNPKIASLAEGVMLSMSSARQSEVKAWEEEITPCEHTLTIEQYDVGHIAASGLATCSACDLKENLWLCLTCGSLGCGRKQFGGLDGNGHGLDHYQQTKHAVSVKLGTITPEGGADIYCYVCNDAKLDLELPTHLATFGINVQTLTKTEKSMTELQIEQNLKYDFSLTDDDGKALEPVFGPGLTGLANLGNSCYMASVLQTIFSLPKFQERYFEPEGVPRHAGSCTMDLSADCLECQMHKLADGLLSGRYSHPAHSSDINAVQGDTLQHPSPTPVFQTGIKPTTFKALVGKGHEEFATMRQQDAEEFFTHLLTTLRRDGQKFKDRAQHDPTTVFSYGTEQRLQCTSCKKVSYKTDTADVVSVAVPATEKGKDADGKTIYEDVKLTDCINDLVGSEALEYSCPSCATKVQAVKGNKFASLPEVLVVHAKKFQLVNWVPTKLDIPIVLPDNDELIFTEAHLGKGLQAGEVELPNESPQPQLQFNEAALSELIQMGFPEVRCQKALLATGNSDSGVAMDWLFSHMDDPDIDTPIQTPSNVGNVGVDPGAVLLLADMGFTDAQAKKALRETSGNTERAVEWLFNHPDDSGNDETTPTNASVALPTALPGNKDVPARYRLLAFVSHKGPSVHSGHYVAHVKKGDHGEWVLFNDEKVVKADAESVKDLKKYAYLYFFVRV
ncbi:ubiquitinyl hydrolase [Pholiota conissans]|uniref:Ubiquitin carboxyl-terminal hydrolase n=1 Tax=Pholiota conissans TaxID=109636 RepID=A0A9P5YR04_9AGAR|nr:ubiquitinyl hydrolase [Pholiota conissans]